MRARHPPALAVIGAPQRRALEVDKLTMRDDDTFGETFGPTVGIPHWFALLQGLPSPPPTLARMMLRGAFRAELEDACQWMRSIGVRQLASRLAPNKQDAHEG